MWTNPANLLPGHKSRSASFENPSAAPSVGGTAANGRKGAASQLVPPGSRVVLADLEGPGVATHFWAVVSKLPLSMTPVFLRSQVIEIFYDELTEPSVSVPMPDFFGAVHGFPVAHSSALISINEGNGFSTRVPMPFDRRVRIEWENSSEDLALLFYQVDFLMGPGPADTGFLHAAFRRENPTQIGRDFVITEGLRGPGRYLGCTAVRVFQKEIRVTLQQIGSASFREGQDAEFAAFRESHIAAGAGWLELEALGGTIGFGLYERSDDWCATSFVYCAEPQPVPRSIEISRRPTY